MKFSIITATYNSIDTIEQCLNSVASQSHAQIEHIIIDGGSKDGTWERIQNSSLKFKFKFKDQSSSLSLNVKGEEGRGEKRVVRNERQEKRNERQDIEYKIVSEADQGIYDALNKGINLASGDVIGLLHSDDVYFDENVIAKTAAIFEKEKIDSVYGDLIYVDKKNPDKVLRYWKSGELKNSSIKNGWMPPHPAFFVKREIYQKYGLFDLSYKIASDYDLILRFLGKQRISTAYLPEVLVKMKIGGKSNKNLKNIMQKSCEDYRALKKNELPHPLSILVKKNISKLPQLFLK